MFCPVSGDKRYSYFVCPRCGVTYLYVCGCVSRRRLEGLPLPVARCHNCGEAMFSGSGVSVTRVRDALKILHAEKEVMYGPIKAVDE